ncbi:amidase family protein, partial [uncultured Variovorax sp.]|uniref:amidase family protein n=1 Tax=uncultured Variovorax sp. TaxID=114708 RepID=UPI0025DA544B
MVHEQNPKSGTPEAAWIARFASPVALTHAAVALDFALPLAGLRFAVKDNIDVAGVPTTAACPTFERLPEVHATVVQRLLEAGASLAGKTNLDQFACGLNGTRSPYGEVPNAFDARYVSGGSSSGSAYVVAAGEVDFALGTDTAGSGRVPAGLNNIVGLKPSRGLLSAFGVVPAAQSADCVSIFARTVATAVDVLLAAAGHDARDPYSRNIDLRR